MRITPVIFFLLLNLISVQAQQLNFEIKGYRASVPQYNFTITEIAFDSAGARDGCIKQKYVYARDTLVLFEGKYEHGRLVDTARWYDQNGTCYKQACFGKKGSIISIEERSGNYLGLAGTPEGEWMEWETVYSVKPVLVKKVQYQNGKLNGTQVYYSRTGSLNQTEQYENGMKQGPAIYYYNNGQTHLQGNFVAGRKSGQWLEYSSKGKLYNSYTYRNDKLEDTSYSYFENGRVQLKSIYKNGIQQGDEWEYDSLGRKLVYRHFTNSVQDSLEIQFYPDGKIAQKLHFRYGFKNGMSWEYYPNGKLKSEGLYRNNWRVGIWKFIGPTGKLLETKDYDKYPDERIGEMDNLVDMAMEESNSTYTVFDQLPQFSFVGTNQLISKDQKLKFLLKYEYIDVIANVDAAGNLFFTILTPMKEEQKIKLNKYLNQTFPKADPANLLGRKTMSQTPMRIRISK